MKVSLDIGSTPNYATVTVGENVWGPTTGKHLNLVDGGDKDSRLGQEEFEARLGAELARLSLADKEASA
jgi:hypothetical protein